RRTKARLKFLLEEVGLEKLMELIKEEWTAIKVKTYVIDRNIVPTTLANLDGISYPEHHIGEQKAYQDWLATNVFEQKQAGFYGVFVKLLLGNMNSKTARSLANIAKTYAADDIRVTINQGYVLRFVRKEALPSLFLDLQKIGLAEAGFDSTADITACPGTDTCNLGISSSTGISRELERVIREEYPDLIHNQDIKIKISGCPNSCGQHGLASIGFHGSSVKNGKMVLPALQVVLGGGVGKDGAGVIADKVIKIPSKRGAQCLRVLLEDYDKNALDGEYYSDYFARMTDKYFYTLLKPLTDLTTLQADDYIDWGHQETFKVETEVGECAGVIIDLFATLMFEIEEKHEWAKEAFAEKRWADSIYHNYNSMIGAAKAILLSKNVKNSSQHSVMTDFDTHFVETKLVDLGETFREYVLQINKNEPSEEFAEKYLLDTISFLGKIKALRQEELDSPIVDKLLTEMLND
ncbi:MAG: HEPN domain-containing protein, partial [Bacteroidetes bacterium]